MAPSKSWLEQLTLSKLHRLAVLTGSPCSGTKSVRISGIQTSLSNASNTTRSANMSDELRILSIDVGIRNLAYAYLKSAQPVHNMATPTPLSLAAWRRLSIVENKRTVVPKSHSHEKNATETQANPEMGFTAVQESFEPIEYASHAYKFIKDLIEKYDPTHVLIERQRFRSGGNSAVLEWTIRVGVFEGMLYAVLRTLIAEGKTNCMAAPILPTRVNRFWLEKGLPKPVGSSSGKILSKAVKVMKINCVGELLEGTRSEGFQFDFTDEAKDLRGGFLSKWKKDKVGRSNGNEGISKLDDLSDCLLQGLAWIAWQKNCNKLQAVEEKAFDL